jgi:hypothetical protein
VVIDIGKVDLLVKSNCGDPTIISFIVLAIFLVILSFIVLVIFLVIFSFAVGVISSKRISKKTTIRKTIRVIIRIPFALGVAFKLKGIKCKVLLLMRR